MIVIYIIQYMYIIVYIIYNFQFFYNIVNLIDFLIVNILLYILNIF
jgi:hypothetical protein